MIDTDIRFFPIGDSAITVEFGSIVSRELNDRAIQLSEKLSSDPFPGLIETVPAYASTSVFYDISEVRRSVPSAATAYEAVRAHLRGVISTLDTPKTSTGSVVEIPVEFGGDHGPDLASLAGTHSLTPDQVIEIFTSVTYRVFMLGFLPGFTYMGEVDERIATPRRNSPRTSVAPGSVGIAAGQTGIYSLESPGGWNIIGRTMMPMFTPEGDQLTRLSAGDEVAFVSVA